VERGLILNDKVNRRVILGTAQLGMEYGRANKTGKPHRKDAIAILKKAIACGVTQLDTARGYGDAEALVGEAVRTSSNADVRIITKLPCIPDSIPSFGREMVRSHVLQSCNQMGTNHLDVLLLHDLVNKTSHEGEVWDELLCLQKEGVIGVLGASIYTPEQALAALFDLKLKIIQLPFNILDKRWDSDFLKIALKKRPDVEIHVRSVLLQGVLQAEATIWPGVKNFDISHLIKNLKLAVKDLRRESIIDLCFAYVMGKTWVNSLVVGVETSEQLSENIRLLNKQPLNQEELDYIEVVIGVIPEKLLNARMWD
jgi:aryl-alcohol dehydrogenase-like predicted oxidoreductase